MRAPRAYDLVMNGIEMGSGSASASIEATCRQMFKMMQPVGRGGAAPLGFLTDANFKYGTTPARRLRLWPRPDLVMILTGSDSLRDVVAFQGAGRGRA